MFMLPRDSFPWNRKYRYSYGDLVIHISKSRNLSLAGRIQLKQYIREWVHSKQEYISGFDWVEAFSLPQSPPPDIAKYNKQATFTDNHSHYRPWKLLWLTTIYCAACGEDSGETAGDGKNLTKLFYGENIYCAGCRYKVSWTTKEAALDGFDFGDREDFEEILILAKQLSGKDVCPRHFK